MVKIAANDVWLILLIVLQKKSMKLHQSVVKMIVVPLLAIPQLPAVPPPATHVIQPPQAVSPLAVIPLPATHVIQPPQAVSPLAVIPLPATQVIQLPQAVPPPAAIPLTTTNSSNPTTTSSITYSSNPTTNDSSNICDSTNDELQEASAEEQEKLFSTVNQATNKPAILRIVQPFAANFVPTVTLSTYPKLLTELYDQSALSLSYPELLKKCETVYHSYKVC